jgi:hypothetical protein
MELRCSAPIGQPVDDLVEEAKPFKIRNGRSGRLSSGRPTKEWLV